MKFRAADEYDVILARKVCLATQVLQGILGAFLLMNTMRPAFHWLLAGVLVAILALTHFGWSKRGCRVLARVLTGILWAAAALFVTDLAMSLGDATAMLGWLETMCILGGLLLSYLSVGAAYISLKGGKYDRIVACFSATWLTALAAAATLYRPVRYATLWSWDNDVVRYVWLAVVAAAAVLTWLCALVRTPEEAAAALAKKQEKTAAK